MEFLRYSRVAADLAHPEELPKPFGALPVSEESGLPYFSRGTSISVRRIWSRLPHIACTRREEPEGAGSSQDEQATDTWRVRRDLAGGSPDPDRALPEYTPSTHRRVIPVSSSSL